MRKFIPFLVIIFAAMFSHAQVLKPQNPPVHVKYVPATTAKAGSIADTKLEVQIDKEWHIFSEHPELNGVTATHIDLAPSDSYTVEKILFPKATPVYSDVFQKNLGFYTDQFTVQIQLKLKPGVSGEVPVKGTLKYQSCSNQICMPPGKLEFTGTLKVS
jgi:hypothetical protein